ncbi:MAG TPA: LytR C-terminal domain-containing protein [Pseudolysinimonas sp.]|nr:LytR C-terminal domain-containing protein [Pseudolysinimonas sp.]
MASFPPDQFDEIPTDLARVGAHRAPARRGLGWLRFGWAALATVVLVVAGLFGLSLLNPAFKLDLPFAGGASQSAAPSLSATPTAEPVTDPTKVDPKLGLSISVLNGSSTDGLQDKAGDAIKAAGWPDPVRANSTTRTEKTTTVYYSTSDFEGIARGLVVLLGVGTIQLTDRYPGAPITIVVGDDYAKVAH